MDKLLVKQMLFYGSYLAFPYLAFLLWRLRRPPRRWLTVGVLLAGLVFVWARFIEPQMIRVRETTLAGTGVEARIVLISDIHLGVYKGSGFLERVVERINHLSADKPVDAVVIAGDLTYEPQGQSLPALFAPLARLSPPVLAVLGNHDQQAPGPDIDLPLRTALAQHGVQVIEGQFVSTQPGYRWAGLGDHWAGKDNPAFLAASPSPLPTLVLMHNPDSALRLSPDNTALALAGHTHGGQIRIPWLYRRVIPTVYPFDRGEQEVPTPHGPVRVFTTTGIGETGLPMRLFNPPTLDVLSLHP